MKLRKKLQILCLAMALALSNAVVPASLASTTAVSAASTKKATGTKVAISAKKLSVKIGDTKTLKVTGQTKGQKVKWKSSSANVATVKSGKVTAVGKGKATITATVGKKKLTCRVTVKAPKINKKSVALKKGKTATLKVTNISSSASVKWASSDENVAAVKNGVVTGVGKGEANITATVGKTKLACKVTVSLTLKLSETDYELYLPSGEEGEEFEDDSTYTFTVKYDGNTVDNTAVKWSSSNEDVATVEDGVVTAVDVGECTVTATYDGEKATCAITVSGEDEEDDDDEEDDSDDEDDSEDDDEDEEAEDDGGDDAE